MVSGKLKVPQALTGGSLSLRCWYRRFVEDILSLHWELAKHFRHWWHPEDASRCERA